MKLSLHQKHIIYGTLWGDGWLQETGERNARLRLEHSAKQAAYVQWLHRELANVFQRAPTTMIRQHPLSHRRYQYRRLQSHSSPFFGDLRRVFYDASDRKVVPTDAARYLPSRLTLAVWYMDDGYYDRRDRSAHIYLPAYSSDNIECLVRALRERFWLTPSWYCRPDRRGCQLNFTGRNREQFLTAVRPYLIPSMRYKAPVTP
jgi:hypothetical protein